MKVNGPVVMLLILLLTACHSGQRREMLALLDEADSLNRAYAQLPSDTLLRQTADFFDRHGTRNDQVRAHYLLGCAYRDQGQAPEALQAYQDALDRADTLSTDSVHNALLCRVYSQMSDIFYRQNLTSYQLESLDRSINCAFACKDTIAAIKSYFNRLSVYMKRNQPDSVVLACNKAYALSISLLRSPRWESITEDRIRSNLSKTKNIPPKALTFSDFCCTFAMSLMIFACLVLQH